MSSSRIIAPHTPASGSATEPNTPEPVSSPPDTSSFVFARLIPINKPAKRALDATVKHQKATPASHHARFLGETVFDNVRTNCFELSLAQLPRFANVGWIIGRGRRNLPDRGVDLMLATERSDAVAGIHARLNWVKGAGGFFLIADNKRGAKVMMNGDLFSSDRRTIPFQNAIMIGECIFTLQYVQRTPAEEESFQVELAAFYRRIHDDINPLVTPTPSEHDASFGDWRVSYTISRGTYGVVYMVTHARDGRPAAAKQILKTGRNKIPVEREIKMATRISSMVHARIASPFEIRHQKSRTKAEVQRIRSLLDESWDPDAFNSITDEYIILAPLLTATFRSLYDSNVLLHDRSAFFRQLLEAVAFLHENGIWHRDIKPDNILVESYHPPGAMLSDFGCASDEDRIFYDWPGTIPYLAPEQVEKRHHGREVDYWATALVGIELLGGPRVNQRVLPGKKFDQYQAFRSTVEPLAASCCRSMLQIDPEARMTAGAARDLLSQSPEAVDTPHSKRRKSDKAASDGAA